MADLGEGTDRWRIRNGRASFNLLGPGDSTPRLGKGSEPFVLGYSIQGMEWVIAGSAEQGIFNGNASAYDADWRLDVLGSTTWFSDASTGHSFGMFNFNILRGDFTNFGADFELHAGTVNVHSTAYEMDFNYFDKVVLGGNVNSGDTSGITHAVDIGAPNQVVISNSSSLVGQEIMTVDRTGLNSGAGAINALV